MLKPVIILVFFILINSVLGQENYGDPTVQYTKKQYKEDLHQLADLIVEAHPKKYEFITKKEFKRLIKTESAMVTDSTSIGQFLWICDEVTGSIQCGHTFAWWPKDFGLIPDSLLFPLDTWSQNFRLYITDARNNSDKVSIGSEILTINGVDVSTVIRQIYNVSPADGNNQPAKRKRVNRAFKTSCPMYFNYPEYYTITVKSNDEIRTIPLDKYQWKEKSPEADSRCSEDLCFEVDSVTNTCLLTIKSFDYYQDDFAVFKAFIDSSFAQINTRGIENLVIDIRGNMGGDSYCGSYLIQHIANRPYRYWAADNNPGFQKDLHDTIQPNKNRFKGTPYVLIDGGCFSTSGHVCSIIKEYHFGILVGEETGSTFTCNDNSLFGNLSNTGLWYRIPQTTFYTSAGSFPLDRGILPDVEIRRTLDDILNHNDPEMKYVLKEISRR